MQGGVDRTYSFNEKEDPEGVGANKDAKQVVKKSSNGSVLDSGKIVHLPTNTTPTPSTKQIDEEAAPKTHISNPFLPCNGNPVQPQHNLMDLAMAVPEIKAPPRPKADRKQIVDSPNICARKPPNPRARYLPKAYSVDVNIHTFGLHKEGIHVHDASPLPQTSQESLRPIQSPTVKMPEESFTSPRRNVNCCSIEKVAPANGKCECCLI